MAPSKMCRNVTDPGELSPNRNNQNLGHTGLDDIKRKTQKSQAKEYKKELIIPGRPNTVFPCGRLSLEKGQVSGWLQHDSKPLSCHCIVSIATISLEYGLP